ncbi:MAG: hypothetical protein J6T26_04975 [Firmicutes bacterium]|nr:hypothetical protein [Bacillota bacterium]
MEERVENRRPSDVFLALWRYYALAEGRSCMLEEFSQLADVWAQIRELENLATGRGKDPSPVCAPVRNDRSANISVNEYQ